MTNKQGVKLYTEEQVRKAIELSQECAIKHDGVYFNHSQTEIIDKITPISLPSDEEIDFEILGRIVEHISFRKGAPWMPSCTSCPPKISSSSTSVNSWIGGISSVAQPIPEEYVVRGQPQPREYHKDLTIIKTKMSNNKQSSVEWLISQLQKSKDWYRVLNELSQMSSTSIDIIEQAKAKHKEEMINFHIEVMKIGLIEEGKIIWEDAYLPKIKQLTTEYYNETFGGNK